MDIVTSDDEPTDALMAARALVLHDLEATSAANPASVSALEVAVSTRRWWASQWEEGKQYVAGPDRPGRAGRPPGELGRWPLCRRATRSTPHALYIHPELGGPDPAWVCEESGIAVAPLGRLHR